MKKIYERGIEIIIFEPNYEGETFKEFMIIKDPSAFDKASNIILANRIDEKLKKFKTPVFSRDLFHQD